MTMEHNQENDPLAQRVLERIKDERLVPRPRWEFIAKNYFFWVLGALAAVLGALSFSATLFELQNLQNIDWRLSVATHPNFFSFFLAAAPLLWLVALVLASLWVYLNVRHTKYGYRYSLIVLALGAVLTSLVLGSVLYAVGVGGPIEESIGDRSPFYRPILAKERSWWSAPTQGLLGGQVVSVSSSTASFVLRDFNGQVWNVADGDLYSFDAARVIPGAVVRMVGVPTTTTTTMFHACFVFSWENQRRFFDEASSPHPLVFASTSQRTLHSATSTGMCTGIRPYQQLQSIDHAGL
jgi:hypothetical protein